MFPMPNASANDEATNDTSVVAYLGLGSNLGNRGANIARALRALADEPGVEILAVSPALRTEPMYIEDQPEFLNTCASVRTTLSAPQLLELLLRLETELGRVRVQKNGPRVIDLDIVFYGDCAQDTEALSIPHPLAMERRFVLDPMVRIAPEFVHPVTGRTMAEHLEELNRTPRSGGR